MRTRLLAASFAVIVLLVSLFAPSNVSAEPQCEAGLAFYGTDDILDDCLEGAGSDCLHCTEIIVVQG